MPVTGGDLKIVLKKSLKVLIFAMAEAMRKLAKKRRGKGMGMLEVNMKPQLGMNLK